MVKIVVDTSVWINYLNGIHSAKTDYLHESFSEDMIILGDIILLEILQGIKNDHQYRKTKDYLEATTQVQMLSPDMAVKYADFYRTLRKNGITIRKSNDVIIAGYCIEHRLPLLQQDRDFEPFKQHFDLMLL